MRLIPLNDGHTVSVFFSALELPIGRYNEFQHYLVQDAGIGSDVESVDRHFANVGARLAAAQADPEQITLAADELALLHYNFHFMLTRTNCKQLGFATLIGAVDGEPTNDLSEESLTALLVRLSDYGLTQGHVEGAIAEFVKKKALS